MATESSGTSDRADRVYARSDTQAAIASPEPSARSPRAPASEMVRMATRTNPCSRPGARSPPLGEPIPCP